MRNIDDVFLGYLKNPKNYKLCRGISYLLLIVSIIWFLLLSVTVSSEIAVASNNSDSLTSVLNKEKISSMDDDGIHTTLGRTYSYDSIKGYTSVLSSDDYYYMPDDKTVSIPMLSRDFYYSCLSTVVAYLIIILAVSMCIVVQHGKKKPQKFLLYVLLVVEMWFMFFGIILLPCAVSIGAKYLIELSVLVLSFILQKIVLNIYNANKNC